MTIPITWTETKFGKKVKTMKPKKVKALCVRTSMIGGGTSYDVYFRCKDKPSRPLHGGYTYATQIYPCGYTGGDGFYSVEDAIDRKERWSMEQGWDKWESHKKLEKVANRLAVRIAKRAFPELNGAKKLPTLWAGWTLPSEEKWVEVNMQLPE